MHNRLTKSPVHVLFFARVLQAFSGEVFTACSFPFNCTQSEKLGAMDVRRCKATFGDRPPLGVYCICKTDQMKHLLTAIACCLAVAGSAQTWNPDADFDNIIGVNDLMALLSVFGTEWTAEYPQDPEFELAAYYEGQVNYFECVRACTNNHARIIGLHEYAMFQDSIEAIAGSATGGNSLFMSGEHGLVRGGFSTYSFDYGEMSFHSIYNGYFKPLDLNYCFCTGLVPAVE